MDRGRGGRSSRRTPIVSSLYFDTAIQVHDALAVLVIAKGSSGRGNNEGVLRQTWPPPAAWSCAVKCACRPSVPPMVQIRLGVSASQSAGLERGFLGVVRLRPRPCLFDPDRRRGKAWRQRIVCQHVAVERVDSGCRYPLEEPSRRLSSTIKRVTPPSRRKAFSCNSAQMRALEGGSADECICGSAEKSTRTAGIAGTCHCADRAPWAHRHNRPVLLRRRRLDHRARRR